MFFKRKPSHPLDRPLFHWPDKTPFTLRHLYRHISIMGASGSGKSSSSGLHFARVLAGIPSGGLILASKPEDRAFWERLFRHRPHDLILFGPKHKARFNFLDFIGGDVRNVTDCILTMSETRGRGKAGGGDDGRFWESMKELTIFNAVTMLKLAYGKVSAPDIRRYISEAGISSAEMDTPEWKQRFHNKTNELAFERKKTPIEQMDYEQAVSYWIQDWPVMADKVRTSVQADISGVLHALNTGIVRDLVSTTSTVSPKQMEDGKWILIDTPIKEYGESGKILQAGWKYITQRYVLGREANDASRPICIWSDEYQNLMNSYDATFLAEARSHKGMMVMLTQSLHSYYAGMATERGQHFVDALLTNAGTKIFHQLGDYKSAEYAASLLDKYLQTFTSFSEGEPVSAYDEIMGQSRYRASVSMQYQWRLQPAEFMSGRTGGPENGYIADGIVLSSDPFRSGERFLRVAFGQR